MRPLLGAIVLSGLALSVSGCSPFFELMLSKPKAVPVVKQGPRPLDAKAVRAKLREIDERTRILIGSEHRRLFRAKTGADAAGRHDALLRSLQNLEPVLRIAEARLTSLGPVPKAVRPMLQTHLRRVRVDRARLRAELVAVRRGQPRSFEGLDVQPDAADWSAPGAYATRPAPELNRFADPFGPSRGQVATDRAIIRYAGLVIPMVHGHNGALGGFLAAMRAGMPSDPEARDAYARAWIAAGMAEDENVMRRIAACGRPPCRAARDYVLALRAQVALSQDVLSRAMSSGESLEEVRVEVDACLNGREYWQRKEAVRLTAAALNARIDLIAKTGTVGEEDWAMLRR